MELKVLRREFSGKTTIGELFINDVFFCYTLEDVDRNLYATMTICINSIWMIPAHPKLMAGL